MADNDFKIALKFSDGNLTNLDNSEFLQSQTELKAPTTRDMILGLGLFSFSIALYSVYCLLIKIMLGTYLMTVPELTYYISLILVVMFYFYARS